MSLYSNCTEWAAAQRPNSPHAKLVLMLIALDTDAGIPEVSTGSLTARAEMTSTQLDWALEHLLHLELIEAVGVTEAAHEQAYAPKGWLV